SRRLVTGVTVLDVEPVPLRRRGAASRRTEELAALSGTPDLGHEVRARGVTTRDHLVAIGAVPHCAGAGTSLPDGLLEVAGYVVDPAAWHRWSEQLERAVDEDRRTRPLASG